MTPREKLQKQIAAQQELIDIATRYIAECEDQMAKLPLDLFILTNVGADDATFEVLVAAATKKKASQIAKKRNFKRWPAIPARVQVEKIGVSRPGVSPQVLMHNFLQKGEIVG